MYCPKCGNKEEDGAVFCSRCGATITSGENNTPMQTLSMNTVEENKINRKKSIFHGFILFIVIIVIGVLSFVFINHAKEDKYINYVKEGNPELYSDITYGQAFGDFFSNPKWKYFKSDGGLDVVEFSGGCLYSDVEVTVNIQFVLNVDEGEFTVEYFAMNDVPQSEFMTIVIMDKVFESYGNSSANHVIEEDISKTEINENDDSQIQETENLQISLNSIDDMEIEEDAHKENREYVYEDLEGEYIRIMGPCSYISIWAVDETGIEFAAAIGCSGWLAYRDLRDCVAEWIDDTTAVYDQGNGEEIKMHFNEDGTFSVEEDGGDYDTMLSLSGTYGKSNDLDLEYMGFILPYSDSQSVLEKDLEGLNSIECKIARNEIYARHGRIFADEMLQNYFESCAWYNGEIPTDIFDISILNDYEQKNAKLISEYEEKMGYK